MIRIVAIVIFEVAKKRNNRTIKCGRERVKKEKGRIEIQPRVKSNIL
jgi:hypothetical protein